LRRSRLMTDSSSKRHRSQGNNQALKDGTSTRTFAFDFEEVDPLIAAFRRHVRGTTSNICEMAITTYICAKAHGKPDDRGAGVSGAGVPPRAILVDAKAGIRTPKDLEGRKVASTAATRSGPGCGAHILAGEHGVD